MKVRLREEPTTTRTHTVWFEPDEGEDWGTMAARGRVFKPNRLCVLVAESGGQVNAYWSQARESHDHGGMEHCLGTLEAENRHQIPEGRSWWWEALFEAEKMIRDAVRGGSA